jgi:HprK-related kinase B
MIEKGDTGLIMHGVAKMPRINPGTALNNPRLRQIMTAEEQERFSRLDEKDLWELEHKYDAFIGACYGPKKFLLSTAMHALVLLNWRHSAETLKVEKVDLAERRDLLPAFMKSVGLFFIPKTDCHMPQPTEDIYIDFLKYCSVWELSGGIDFKKAARKCLEL